MCSHEFGSLYELDQVLALTGWKALSQILTLEKISIIIFVHILF